MGIFDRFRQKQMQKDLVEQLQIQKVETREKKTVDAIRKPVEIHYSLRAEEKLDQMDHKLDELLEIKKLYEDMLDWMVELAKESRNRTNRDMSSTAHDTSIDQSILSPRLKQVLDVVKARGEILAEDAVQSTGLSLNRCSEILNALYRANFIEKHRVGREVYYRVNAGGAAKLTQDAGA